MSTKKKQPWTAKTLELDTIQTAPNRTTAEQTVKTLPKHSRKGFPKDNKHTPTHHTKDCSRRFNTAS
ncbi:MAG: hypothetical protein WC046_04790 [Candidatus Bathyarchaeia archaeon]